MKALRPDIDTGKIKSITDLLGLNSGDELSNLEISHTKVQNAARGVYFKSCKLIDLELIATELPDVNLRDCIVSGSDFSGATLAPCYLERVLLTKDRLSGAQLYEGKVKDVIFDNCKLDMTNFRSAKFKRVIFKECQMTSTDFSGAVFEDVEMSDCSLEQVNFSNSKAISLDLRGSKLQEITGVTSLKGARISPEQLISITNNLAAEIGLKVDYPD